MRHRRTKRKRSENVIRRERWEDYQREGETEEGVNINVGQLLQSGGHEGKSNKTG